MAEPKEIYSFVVVEFLADRGFAPNAVLKDASQKDSVYYAKGAKVAKFDRSKLTIPAEAVEKLLDQVGYTYEEFSGFCKEFMTTQDFENGLKESMKAPKYKV